MSLFMQHIDRDYRWAIWKNDETIEELLELIPEHEKYRSQIERFSAPHRRMEWLSVRVLLFTLLGKNVDVAYATNGRPYLRNLSASISISHTKGYVAVLLAKSSCKPGVDIEQYGERVCKVAHRFMHAEESPSEYAGITIWSLLLHWSAKETMFKAMDVPEVDFRTHLRVMPFKVQEHGCFEALESRTKQRRHFHIHYLLHPDFVFTWSVD